MIGNDMAFPVMDRNQTPNATTQLGLTKRELLAAMAMQGLLRFDDAEVTEMELAGFSRTMARYAVAYADALLAELDSASGERKQP